MTKIRVMSSVMEALERRVLLSGLTPAEVRHAYAFDRIHFTSGGTVYQGSGRGQTIAIVDAYDNPKIAHDLRVFDSAFDLPNQDTQHQFVLTKATPQGTPAFDSGWAGEIALDVEWAHAIAPKAHILLVEAASASYRDLLTAVDYAKNQTGVVAVSMSWSGYEFSGETSLDPNFTTPANHVGGSGLAGGVAFFAASGDSGAPSGWPSTSPNVIAVGGTTFTIDAAGNYITESAWSGSGGGISRVENTQGPDVSYDADPNTGFDVYDSSPV